MDLLIRYGVPVIIGLTIGFLLLNRQKAKEANVTVLDADTFKKNMRKGQLIDIRSQKRFEEEKIKGARNFRPGYLKSKQQTKVRKDKPLYLYDDKGFKSRRVAKKLHRKGFKELYVLDGGYQAYKKIKK